VLTDVRKAEVASECEVEETRREILNDRLAEAFRECGLLWLVFSALDKLVEGHLSLSWTAGNCLGALAAWSIGAYIELKDRRHG
jgi:hypothetical protein